MTSLSFPAPCSGTVGCQRPRVSTRFVALAPNLSRSVELSALARGGSAPRERRAALRTGRPARAGSKNGHLGETHAATPTHMRRAGIGARWEFTIARFEEKSVPLCRREDTRVNE